MCWSRPGCFRIRTVGGKSIDLADPTPYSVSDPRVCGRSLLPSSRLKDTYASDGATLTGRAVVFLRGSNCCLCVAVGRVHPIGCLLHASEVASFARPTVSLVYCRNTQHH